MGVQRTNKPTRRPRFYSTRLRRALVRYPRLKFASPYGNHWAFSARHGSKSGLWLCVDDQIRTEMSWRHGESVKW